MRIMHILPELEEGGVERHVLMLSGQQRGEGHEVYIVSDGGKLVSQIANDVVHISLPVHLKNPFIVAYCALRLVFIFRKFVIEIVHAHSRVPSWIIMLASKISRLPYFVTAHVDFGNHSKWIYLPYRRADKVICVSKAVQDAMSDCFAENTVMIRNGMPDVSSCWVGSNEDSTHFLFVGRLSQVKGLQDILKILPYIEGEWHLDVVGDGPLRGKLEALVESLNIKERVLFHGYRDDVDLWMIRSDCLLFPSYREGMPLTVARAIQIGLPIIASDIGPIREMAESKKGLVRPGDLDSWKDALQTFLITNKSRSSFDKNIIPSIPQMTEKVELVYLTVHPSRPKAFKKTVTYGPLTVLHMVPELEEGGVERHVLMLSGQQQEAGHQVYVVSAGGKLVSQVANGVRHVLFPVHRKNPLVGIYCAIRLASVVRRNKIDIIHAHSRVPAWIAMFTNKITGKPYIITAHAYFSNQSKWIYVPFRKANRVICVSKSVQSGMKNCFAENTVVIRNGMPAVKNTWKGSGGSNVNFLFVGRLTQLKGLQDILQIAPSVAGNWKLDVLGDGSLRKELEEMVKSLRLEEKVFFHGFQDDPDAWMEKSDCLLFPSHIEGMPLTLARAIQIGIPVIASDIEPIREMALGKDGLVKSGDSASWEKAIETFFVTRQSPADFDKNAIPTILQMTQEVQSVYESAICPEGDHIEDTSLC